MNRCFQSLERNLSLLGTLEGSTSVVCWASARHVTPLRSICPLKVAIQEKPIAAIIMVIIKYSVITSAG